MQGKVTGRIWVIFFRWTTLAPMPWRSAARTASSGPNRWRPCGSPAFKASHAVHEAGDDRKTRDQGVFEIDGGGGNIPGRLLRNSIAGALWRLTAWRLGACFILGLGAPISSHAVAKLLSSLEKGEGLFRGQLGLPPADCLGAVAFRLSLWIPKGDPYRNNFRKKLIVLFHYWRAADDPRRKVRFAGCRDRDTPPFLISPGVDAISKSLATVAARTGPDGTAGFGGSTMERKPVALQLLSRAISICCAYLFLLIHVASTRVFWVAIRESWPAIWFMSTPCERVTGTRGFAPQVGEFR